MNLLNQIFRSNMVSCPRCLGKGNVDMEDIKRLQKELFWLPGKCAYCNGMGKVPAGRAEKISADLEYLTTDLSSWERLKLINGDGEALERANEFRDSIEHFIKEVEHLYYIGNKEPAEIAEHLFLLQGQAEYTAIEKQELTDYITKVIERKLKK